VAAPRTAIARKGKKIKIVRYIHTYYYWTTIHVNKVVKSFLGWGNLLPCVCVCLCLYIYIFFKKKKNSYILICYCIFIFFSLYILSLFWTKKPQQPPKENLILKSLKQLQKNI
jgi:D-alanyl-lipoteichoic acid acyltransferase DltB (MBOAT superfamily)